MIKPGCFTIGDSNSKSKEEYIQCLKCHGWAYELCSNTEKYYHKFISDFYS